MNIKELKSRIGVQSENIIASDLGLQKSGNKYIGQCPHGGHSKDNPVFKWENDHFFCYDCRKGYDIIDLMRSKGGEWYNELCIMAGVEIEKKQWVKIQPASRKRTESGISYLQSRGISPGTMKKYHITTDEEHIYFNYLTPQKELLFTKWRNFKATDKNRRFRSTEGGTSIFYGMHLLDKQTDLLICEGEIDALSIYEIIKEMELDSRFLCSSLPNGSGSLNQQLVENSKGWLNQFERIVIIPDQDEAGKKFIKDAQKMLGDYPLGLVTLPCLDVNEYLMNPDFPDSNIFSTIRELLPELEHTSFLEDIHYEKEYNGKCSGFVGIDYNLNGLKDGWVTLVTGLRGDGKTTLTRQILLSYAKQGMKSYMFCGESSKSDENALLARLECNRDSIIRSQGQGGRTIFTVDQPTVEQFSNKYANLIGLSDMSQIKNKTAYDAIFGDMKKLVRHGVKLFIIDNMMKLTIHCKGGQVFDTQRQIITDLKVFAVAHNVHIILIVHPNAGGEKISGVQEIENTADAILRYVRVKDPLEDKVIKSLDLPEIEKSKISAVVKTEKGRKEATYHPSYIEWDTDRGAVINVSSLPCALEYEQKGYWTRAISRMTDADIPDQSQRPYKED